MENIFIYVSTAAGEAAGRLAYVSFSHYLQHLQMSLPKAPRDLPNRHLTFSIIKSDQVEAGQRASSEDGVGSRVCWPSFNLECLSASEGRSRFDLVVRKGTCRMN